MMTLRKMKPEERASYWQAMITEWRASGLSQKKFAKSKGIHQSSLSKWVQRSLNHHPKNFAAVIVSPTTSPNDAQINLILHLNGRSRLEIPSGLSTDAMKNLFSALGLVLC